MGGEILQGKTVLIFNNQVLNKPSGAAFSRMFNYAKALTESKAINVVFCSFQHKLNPEKLFEIEKNIFISGQAITKQHDTFNKHLSKFLYPVSSYCYLRRINHLLNSLSGEIIVLVFSMRIFNDIFLLIKFKLMRGVKIYVEKNELLHTIHIGEKYERISGLKKFLLSINNKVSYLINYCNDVLVRYYDGVIAITKAIDNWCIKYNSNRIIVPILTDCELFKKGKDTANLRRGVFTIGYMGQLNNKKDGILYLLRAVNNLNNQGYSILLNLYGMGSKREMIYLRNYIYSNKLDTVILKGNYSYELLIKELVKHDLLIMPRPYSKQGEYGFATKLADYLASGTPVLTTSISENSKYIKHGFNGFLIDYHNLDDLADHIICIMQNTNLKLIGSRGRSTAEECFDFRNYSEILRNFLFNNESSNT